MGEMLKELKNSAVDSTLAYVEDNTPLRRNAETFLFAFFPMPLRKKKGKRILRCLKSIILISSSQTSMCPR